MYYLKKYITMKYISIKTKFKSETLYSHEPREIQNGIIQIS